MKRASNWIQAAIEQTLLSVFGRVRAWGAATCRPAPRSILAFESFGVGDVVCALPAVRALKQYYPEARVIFVTSRAALQFCEGLPFLDHCVLCPRGWDGVRAFLRTWRPDRAETLAVLLNDGWWQNLSVALLQPRWACGYLYRPRLDRRYHPLRLRSASWDRSARGLVDPATHLVHRALYAAEPALSAAPTCAPYGSSICTGAQGEGRRAAPLGPPASQRFASSGAIAGGAPVVPALPELASLPRGRLPAWLDALLAEREGEGYWVCHPGTSDPAKRWPEPSWRALLQGLAERGPVFLTGGGDEAVACQTLAEGLRGGHGVQSVAGRLDLAHEARLMAGAACCIGPDCGPLHLASAVGAPTLALMGPTAPRTSAPYWPPAAVVHEPGPEGMARISVKRVWEALRGSVALARRESRAPRRAPPSEPLGTG